MNVAAWIVGAVALPLLLLIGYIIAVRVMRPHSAKLYARQQQSQQQRPSAGAAGAPNAPPPPAGGAWYKEHIFLSILLLIVGVVALWWVSTTESPSLKTVWTETKDHWLWILIAIGAIFFATYLIFPKGKEDVAGALRKAVVVVVVLLWGIIPICNQIWGEKPPPPPDKTTMGIPLSSADMKTWPQVTLPPKGDVFIPTRPDYRLVVAGGNNDFRLFTVYERGRECEESSCGVGPTIGGHIVNTSENENTVIFAVEYKPDLQEEAI